MRDFLRAEWAKLRVMTLEEKWQYFWEYYKMQFLIIVGSVAIVIGLINVWFINPARSEYFHVAWLGDLLYEEQINELAYRLEVIVEDPSRQQIVVTSYTATYDARVNASLQVRFVANMTMGSIDVFLTSARGVYEIAGQGFIRPVHDLVAALPDWLLFLADEDRLLEFSYYHGGEYTFDVMGLSVAGSPLLAELGIDCNDLYIALVVNSERVPQAVQALEVMFE
ncbi:MAG: hypothetical protein FWC78_08290 [Defluviitaleaceae bacterium]|nr:hypothetical protein [Defluviitaleaceae bacterium]